MPEGFAGFVPAPEHLTAPSAQVGVRGTGGRVIEGRDEWAWHDPDGQQAAMAAFLAELPGAGAGEGGPEMMRGGVRGRGRRRRERVHLCILAQS